MQHFRPLVEMLLLTSILILAKLLIQTDQPDLHIVGILLLYISIVTLKHLCVSSYLI